MKHESQIIKDEHDELLNAKRVTMAGNTTIFAVVNTSAGGQASIALDSSVASIGFATVNIASQPIMVIGNATGGLADTGNPVKVGGRYNSTLPTYSDGQRTEVQTSTRGAVLAQLVGVNSNSGANVFTTTGDNQAYSNGLAVHSQNVIFNGTNWDRMKTANNANATTGAGVLGAGNLVFDGTNWRRMLGSTDGTLQGNVTAWSRNAGTTKTLANIPVVLSTASIQTLATPATNLTMYVTNVLLNSDATVRVSIKSGVTYLTGNASIGIVINPGGGWVETGSPDSPTYIGCPSGALIVEKFDMTGTRANVGGKLVFFSE